MNVTLKRGAVLAIGPDIRVTYPMKRQGQKQPSQVQLNIQAPNLKVTRLKEAFDEG